MIVRIQFCMTLCQSNVYYKLSKEALRSGWKAQLLSGDLERTCSAAIVQLHVRVKEFNYV